MEPSAIAFRKIDVRAGHIGLMGVVADAVLSAGGRAIGVIPQSLVDKELAHRTLTELHIVETMHQRKALMADLSDAFLALPDGYGTLNELFEILDVGPTRHPPQAHRSAQRRRLLRPAPRLGPARHE